MKIRKKTIFALILIISLNTSVSFGNEENDKRFKNVKNNQISVVGVAITTNIGIRGKNNKNTINSSVFNEIISIDGILSIRNSRKDSLIKKNGLHIKEYLNLLKTDVKILLNSSRNIERTLRNFTRSLEIKYRSSTINKINLKKQVTILKSGLVITGNKIDTIKIKISRDFKKFDSKETNKNIKQYLKLREQYTIIRTYLIFVSKFIAQYDFLNSYNKTLLDTLINNKDIIIKKSFVVIPDTGSDLLEQLDLIISEEEFKSGREE